MSRKSPAALQPAAGAPPSRLAALERSLAEREAELAALREREQIFRLIVESLDRIFWIVTPDLDRVVYLNPASERILGRSRQSIYENPRSWIEAIHPADRERLLAAAARRVQGLPVEPEYQLFRILRPGGGTRWLRGRGMLVPVPGQGTWYLGIAEDVTELKRAADAESERAATLRMLTEQLPAVMWSTDLDLVFTSSTGRGLSHLHLEQNQAVGMRLQDYFGTEDPSFLPLAAHLRALSGESVAFVAEWAGRVYESHVEPLRDGAGSTIGVLGLGLDVTARRQAEVEAEAAHEDLRRAHEELQRMHAEVQQAKGGLEARVEERTAALRRAKERLEREIVERRRAEESVRQGAELYRLLADNSTDVISRVSPAGIWLYISPACRCYGYAPEELIGRNGYEFIHLDDIEVAREAHERLLASTAPVSFSFRFRCKDGRYVWVEITGRFVPAPEAGGAGEIISIARDVSERKEVEERVARLQHDLAHVARLSVVGEMASGLAHELNQPLTAIVNYLDAARRLLAVQVRSVPEALAAIAEAASEAERASKIILGLRAFVRRGDGERAAADANALIREVIELAAADIRAAGVKLSLRLAPELLPVHVNRVQIQQVILNLVRNALEAMVDGGERRLTIRSARAGDGEVKLTVQDSGPGIAAGGREHLFEPFFSTKGAGMGLGLPISVSIIEAHGGRLWVDPGSKRGAAFSFTLPATATGAERYP